MRRRACRRRSNPYDPKEYAGLFWTLGRVVSANREAGGHFFDRKTLRGFGETLRSFKVVYEGDNIYVVRKRDGKRWRFDPDTGRIGPSVSSNPRRKRRNPRRSRKAARRRNSRGRRRSRR